MRMAFPEGLTSPEMEIAEGGVILDNRTRFADLKTMLDSSKDNLKVDAMKRIINLIAKGKDVSELFPAVVKNVAAKNVELKKLVYVYLVRYAEEQQDLALLSISTFQRALKDPNQLIRASALRVLSSIRVGMIAPIMLLAIKDSVRDMSPYVRKVAAHAIPKLYSLEPDLEAELVDCIDFLLADRRSLVLGSAVYAFQEICPNRLDLLHKHFRALCRALADVDEWGQVVMINLLTRYARSELADPELLPQPDVDLTLLLNSARPLLQSRNCSVVMAVTQLFYYIAPKAQLSQVARALVRLLRGPREVQYIVLLNIATICERNPNMFDPFLKSFFVRSSDPSFVKELKLHILTSLVSEANVHIILRELQTYVGTSDLAGAAIEAIGRCAVRVKAVSEQCLAGLVQLITSPNENVVCSAVVVLKRLLHAEATTPLLSRLARLIRSIQAPAARACIVWLIATHVEKVPNIAPDLLRILAKNFVNEDEIVKVETLKLAVKLWMIRREESEKLVHYVFQLARFDLSYDVRDRCRFLRNLLFNTTVLSKHAEQIFMAKKPAPALQSSFKEREQFQLGTLSHVLNQRCARYCDLPSFPQVSSDPALRREANSPEEYKYEDDEEVEEEDEEYDEDEEDEEGEEEEEDEEEEEGNAVAEDEGTAEDESSEEDESDEEESEEESDEASTHNKHTVPKNSAKGSATTNGHTTQQQKKPETKTEKKAEHAIDLLLDLDFSAAGCRQIVDAEYCSNNPRPILNRIEGDGIELSILFPRTNDLQYTPIRFTLLNTTEDVIEGVKISPPEDSDAKGAMEISSLRAGESTSVVISIDLNDRLRQVEWRLSSTLNDSGRSMPIEVPVGEQVQPIRLADEEVEKERRRMGGLNRHTVPLAGKVDSEAVLAMINAHEMPNGYFTCQTRSRKDLVIIRTTDKEVEVSSDNAVFGKMLATAVQSVSSSK
ncbi:unnamed protein product [Cylicocyclus nassatus]|uniref:AP-3 complex subunit beta n=1 Tax=Cylicocyclus nassatus TaxID=53992 RepID=A0AA36GKW4_CYLNA|nr:unnamed protein product [Cylicocyclus nassatus]